MKSYQWPEEVALMESCQIDEGLIDSFQPKNSRKYNELDIAIHTKKSTVKGEKQHWIVK